MRAGAARPPAGGERKATVVTIDGPAGAGKSTIASALAVRLGVPHVDTGAYYRAATLAVLRADVPPEDAEGCLKAVSSARIERGGGHTRLNGEDVECEIRGPAVTAAVSAVSAHPEVRAALLAAQRGGIGEEGAVVEGRDAGTVVAPDADLKVWLTASSQARAARRAEQLGQTGQDPVRTHAADLARRDALDARQMVPAPDAVVIDTTDREVGAVVEEIARLALAR
ncbi:MAG: (d)CMP kinase [Egibacteraceae bacterium]